MGVRLVDQIPRASEVGDVRARDQEDEQDREQLIADPEESFRQVRDQVKG